MGSGSNDQTKNVWERLVYGTERRRLRSNKLVEGILTIGNLTAELAAFSMFNFASMRYLAAQPQ
jgi:hypothetical protein